MHAHATADQTRSSMHPIIHLHSTLSHSYFSLKSLMAVGRKEFLYLSVLDLQDISLFEWRIDLSIKVCRGCRGSERIFLNFLLMLSSFLHSSVICSLPMILPARVLVLSNLTFSPWLALPKKQVELYSMTL